jgi:hypothetical protein
MYSQLVFPVFLGQNFILQKSVIQSLLCKGQLLLQTLDRPDVIAMFSMALTQLVLEVLDLLSQHAAVFLE